MLIEAEKNTHQEEEIVSMELSAPHGWKKQLCPKKGGTPRKSEIVFTAPTGEEIHTQRQLQQYLKSHPGGPPASDFDWGTGETPRRSARISEKAKAAPQTPESESPRKRSRKSSASKKDGRDSEAIDEEKGAQKTETEKTGGEAEDVQMKEAEQTQKEETPSEGEKDIEMSKVGIEEVAKEEQTEKKKEVEEKGVDNGEQANIIDKHPVGDTKVQAEKQDDVKNIEGGKDVEKEEVAKEEQTGNKEPVSETNDGVSMDSKPKEEKAADNGDKPNDDVKNIEDGKENKTSLSTIDGETPKAEDEPKPEREKQDGVQEPVKLDEQKPEPKDNGTARGTLEDLRAKDSVEKAVEITENGAQAVEAGI